MSHTRSETAPIYGAKELIAQLSEAATALHYGESPAELYEPISYLMALGGKRLRPVLTLLSGQLYSAINTGWVHPALGIEVFHNFTLMHDDIMDGAPLRRGQPTVHTKWNPNVGILSGDVMLVAAYKLLMQVPDHNLRPILNKFNQVAAEVCEGQQLDMNFERLPLVSIPDYLNMIRLKTAVLLGFSCRLGALLACTSDDIANKLDHFGTTIGIGFQLMDDILDVYADQAAFGKRVGGDIVTNKKTFLLISALELAKQHPELEADLQHALHEIKDEEEKVAVVTSIYNKLGIRNLAEDRMRAYYDEGLAILDQLDGVDQAALVELRGFVLSLMHRTK